MDLQTNMHVRDKILILLDSWQEAFGGRGGKHSQYYWSYEELKVSIYIHLVFNYSLWLIYISYFIHFFSLIILLFGRTIIMSLIEGFCCSPFDSGCAWCLSLV